MAETLGLVASVLAICEAVEKGRKVVVELHRAPAEIGTLQVGHTTST